MGAGINELIREYEEKLRASTNLADKIQVQLDDFKIKTYYDCYQKILYHYGAYVRLTELGYDTEMLRSTLSGGLGFLARLIASNGNDPILQELKYVACFSEYRICDVYFEKVRGTNDDLLKQVKWALETLKAAYSGTFCLSEEMKTEIRKEYMKRNPECGRLIFK